VPSTGKLSLIQDLRHQLKRAQQEVKRITALIDVVRSKASLAAATECSGGGGKVSREALGSPSQPFITEGWVLGMLSKLTTDKGGWNKP
jgi:hypothetical protein